MSTEELDPPPRLNAGVYEQMLDNTREVADKALARLRGLSDQLPGGAIEHVERLHDNPVSERRKAARLNDPSIPVAVQAINLQTDNGETLMKDHCPSGLAVLMPCPAGVGTVIRVRMPEQLGDGGWVSVEVKYCRKEGERWVAGCELLDQGPL